MEARLLAPSAPVLGPQRGTHRAQSTYVYLHSRSGRSRHQTDTMGCGGVGAGVVSVRLTRRGRRTQRGAVARYSATTAFTPAAPWIQRSSVPR